jgi:thioredoxin 1
MDQISAADFQEKVINAQIPVFLDFGAEWCGPCRQLEPILEEYAKLLSGKVRFYRVDAGQCPDLVQQLGVMTLPTVVLFKNGKASGTMVGLRPRPEIEKFINQAFG